MQVIEKSAYKTEQSIMSLEAGNLGKLQTESGEKARMVAASSEDTVEHSEQVLKMVNQMQELLENTLNQANQIVQESSIQKDVTKEVENSFHHVNDVSKSLLEIGRIEVTDSQAVE